MYLQPPRPYLARVERSAYVDVYRLVKITLIDPVHV